MHTHKKTIRTFIFLPKSCTSTYSPKSSNHQSTISLCSPPIPHISYSKTSKLAIYLTICPFPKNPCPTLSSSSYTIPSIRFSATVTQRKIAIEFAARNNDPLNSPYTLQDRILWKQTFTSINIVEGVACLVGRG